MGAPTVTVGSLTNIQEVDGFFPSGGKPGKIVVVCDDDLVPAIGEIMSVSVEQEGETISLANCRVVATKPKSDSGALATVVLEDCRWKWQYTPVGGTWNANLFAAGGGAIIKTAEQLWDEIAAQTGVTITKLGTIPSIYPAFRWTFEMAAGIVETLCEASGCSALPDFAGNNRVRIGAITDSLPGSADNSIVRKKIAPRKPTTVRLVPSPDVYTAVEACEMVLPDGLNGFDTWAGVGVDIDAFNDDFSSLSGNYRAAVRNAAFRLFRCTNPNKKLLPGVPMHMAGWQGPMNASMQGKLRSNWDCYQAQLYADPGGSILVSDRRYYTDDDDMGIGTTHNVIVSYYDATGGELARTTRDVAITGGTGGAVDWYMPWVQLRQAGGEVDAQLAADVLGPYDAIAQARWGGGADCRIYPGIAAIATKGEVTGVRFCIRNKPHWYARTFVWTKLVPSPADGTISYRQYHV